MILFVFVHFELTNCDIILIFYLVIFLSYDILKLFKKVTYDKRHNINGGIRMKIKAIILTLAVGATLLVGCGAKKEATTAPVPAKTETATTKTDVVTTASIVKDQDSFQKAVGKKGFWLVGITQDLTIDKEIILEGEFTKADKVDATKKIPAGRKLALYAQDDKKVKTATYTLKAPKMTIKSENSKIQGGKFVGDVYVEAKGFTIVDGKVEGNVYFASEAIKSTYKLGKGGSVTGTVEVKK